MTLTELSRDRFALSRYRGLLRLKHLNSGVIGYGTSILEAMDQVLDLLTERI